MVESGTDCVYVCGRFVVVGGCDKGCVCMCGWWGESKRDGGDGEGAKATYLLWVEAFDGLCLFVTYLAVADVDELPGPPELKAEGDINALWFVFYGDGVDSWAWWIVYFVGCVLY